MFGKLSFKLASYKNNLLHCILYEELAASETSVNISPAAPDKSQIRNKRFKC